MLRCPHQESLAPQDKTKVTRKDFNLLILETVERLPLPFIPTHTRRGMHHYVHQDTLEEAVASVVSIVEVVAVTPAVIVQVVAETLDEIPAVLHEQTRRALTSVVALVVAHELALLV